MIYIQNGLKTKHLKPIKQKNNNDFLDFYNLEIQTYQNNTDIKNFKQNTAKYCICGEVKDNIRKNENLINRTLIFIDYDDLQVTNDEFISTIKKALNKYNYIMYPTISHTKEKPRYRLVIQPNRPIVNEDEYKATIKEITDKINLPYDHSSNTWSQLQGLPICNEKEKDNYKIIKHTGGSDYLVVTPKPKNKPILKDNVYSNINRPLQNKKQNNGTVLAHNKAIEIFMDYIENDKENLQTYDNFLTVIMVLAKSVQDSIIDLDTAIMCSELLAFDNPEWIEENRNFLINSLKEDIRTEYTFFNKFIVWNKKEPKTNAELMEILKKIGANERLKRAEFEKDFKIKPLSINTIKNILIQNCYIKRIGTDKDNTPLYFYDYDNGIYELSHNFINKLIDCIEPSLDPNNWVKVHKKIALDIPLVEPFEDETRIVVNNGIFNIKTKELEPFSPDYNIVAKISTKYNPNAKNPINYFNVDKWFQELACNDVQVYSLLWEMINEAVNPHKTRRKVGILLGKGLNGKSTYQQMLINLIGKSNVSNLTLEQLQGFELSQLIGKVANIGDDISNLYFENSSQFKSLVSGDNITINIKHKAPITLSTKAFILYSANEMPKMRDKTNGVLDRLLLIPFNADFKKVKKDIRIKTEYIYNDEVLEYILYTALSLGDFKEFTNSKAVEELIQEYEEENNPLIDYINNEYIERGLHDIVLVPVELIKQDYKRYLKENGKMEYIPNSIGKQIADKLNAKNIEKRKYFTTKKKCYKLTQMYVDKNLLEDWSHIRDKFENAKYTKMCIFCYG